MNRKITMMLAFLFLTTACSHEGPPARENMLKNKSFVYLFFSTEEECRENQPEPDFFQNCHQQVDFYKNNVVEIMLTDIMYRGTYDVIGNVVILTFEPSFEIPEGILLFEIINGSKLLKTDNNTVWKKMSGNSIWR